MSGVHAVESACTVVVDSDGAGSSDRWATCKASGSVEGAIRYRWHSGMADVPTPTRNASPLTLQALDVSGHVHMTTAMMAVVSATCSGRRRAHDR
jgi:hypothetical protein